MNSARSKGCSAASGAAGGGSAGPAAVLSVPVNALGGGKSWLDWRWQTR